MKFLFSFSRFIFHFLLALLIVCFSLLVVVNVFGASILESFLSKILPSCSVSVDSLRILPPYLSVKGFYCAKENGPELRVNSIKLKVDILKQDVSWVEIRGVDVRLPLVDTPEKSGETNIRSPLRLLLGLTALPIKEVMLFNSIVHFVRGGENIGNIRVLRIVLYRPMVKNRYFSFNSRIVVESGEQGRNGRLRCDGWLDWDNKNALFTLEGKELDMAFLSKLFSLPDIKGIMYLRVEGNGRDNDLVLKNYVKVKQFFVPQISVLKKVPILPAFLPVVEGLSRPEFSLEFTVETQLDNPKIELKRHILDAIRKMVKNGEAQNNKEDEGQIYDIINDLAGLVGSVVDSLQDIVR